MSGTSERPQGGWQHSTSLFLLLRHAPALLGGLLLQQAPGWRGLVSVTPEPKQSPAEMGDTWDHVRTQHRVTDHQTHWLMAARKRDSFTFGVILTSPRNL